MSEYTTSIGAVRETYAWGGPRVNPTDKQVQARREAFDRWLAERDRKVAAWAWDDAVDAAGDSWGVDDRSVYNPYREVAR